MDRCIPANPDISGIGVRTAIYAQNLLSFAPVVAHLWDRRVTSNEVKSMEGQSVGILSIAFAILISTILQANTKTASQGQLITNFHAAVILDLSWMNNTSTFIWFLLYAHHRCKTDKNDEAIPATWSAWTKVLLSPLCWVTEVEMDRTAGERESDDIDRKEVGQIEITRTSKAFLRLIRRSWDLVSRAPVLTLGSIHLSLMAVIGIWLWSDPRKFGASTTECNPSLVIVGGAVRFSSPALRICSLLLYSLLLIPGFNLAIPFLIFLAPHIFYNHSRRRHPQFWERCRHILNTFRDDIKSLRRSLHALRRISATLRGKELQALSDPESQASSNDPPTTSAAQPGQSLSPSAGAHTALLVGGLLCLLAINIIFLVDIELTLSRNKPIQIQGEGIWGFGQVLALLLLVVPLRDFVSSILEIRQRLMEERQLREIAQKRFEESLRHAIENNTFEGHDFRYLIERGADPNTQIKGMIPYYRCDCCR